MRNIEGFVFFDKSLDSIHQRMPIFGAGTQYKFTIFQTNLETFSTPQEAVIKARQYHKKFFDRNPNPIISKLEMSIPETLKEEQTLSERTELVITIPQYPENFTKLIGAPMHGRQRYCNSEIRAAELTHNKITPYYPIAGETAYEIALEARSEIIRQSEQTNIFIAKFSLKKHADSMRLVHYP